MIILYFHLPDYMLPEYCIPTQTWMRQLENEGYRVIDVPTPINQDEMYKGYLDNWGIDDILICEQENVGTVELIEEMKNCHHQFCASPCEIYPASLGFDRRMINMIDFVERDEGIEQRLYDMKYLNTKEFVSGICGGGLSMIKKELQLKMDIKNNSFHHQNSDYTLSNLARPYMPQGFHLHGLHENMKKF